MLHREVEGGKGRQSTRALSTTRLPLMTLTATGFSLCRGCLESQVCRTTQQSSLTASPATGYLSPMFPVFGCGPFPKALTLRQFPYTDNAMPQRPTEKPPGRAAKCAQRTKVKAEGMVHRRGAGSWCWHLGKSKGERKSKRSVCCPWEVYRALEC